MPKVEYLNGHHPTPTFEKWERMMKIRPRLPQLIENLHPDAPGEFSLISGRTGIGKTNLQMHMAFALATGSTFLGMACSKVVVNMLVFEGAEDNVPDRPKKVMKLCPTPEDRQ